MKRIQKNILTTSLMILLAASIGFTIFHIKTQSKPSAPSSQTQQQSSAGGSAPGNTQTPGGDNNKNSNNKNTNRPPEKPSGSSGNSSQQPPDMKQPSGKQPSMKISTSSIALLGAESFLFSLCLLYLIFSSFHKKTFRETFISGKKSIAYGVISLLLAGGLTFGESFMTQKSMTSNGHPQLPSQGSNIASSGVPSSSPQSHTKSVKYTASKIISKSSKTLSGTYKATKKNQCGILVKNGGSLTLKNAVIQKSSGDSSNTENSEFYGTNSGLLVTSKSSATINNTKITTSAKGSNAVFATGSKAKIKISNSTITTTGNASARGLDATYGGTILANHVTVQTAGNSCASLATDRGEGTVTAKNSDLSTKGAGSPVIYSTGNISVNNTKGTASGSQMVVIEGKNSATVTNSTLSASGAGNRNNVDNAGIMIYQSMSGNASTGTGTFTAKNSTLSVSKNSSYYKKAPMFFVTNTDAVINLTDTKLSYGSNTLLSVKGTSEWGQSGSNGGTVKLNASKQTFTGNINLDKLSTLTMKLSNSSTYTGTINAKNSAKKISLTLDSSSKMKLTGDSYVTSLNDKDSSYSNIDFNGYTLYVNGKAINK